MSDCIPCAVARSAIISSPAAAPTAIANSTNAASLDRKTRLKEATPRL
jgi:hypothetical protein